MGYGILNSGQTEPPQKNITENASCQQLCEGCERLSYMFIWGQRVSGSGVCQLRDPVVGAFLQVFQEYQGIDCGWMRGSVAREKVRS